MSSGGKRLGLTEAEGIAEQLLAELVPVVKRAVVAGSVRRRRTEVGDIELVIEPLDLGGLLDGGGPDVEAVRRVAQRWGRLVKNGDRFIQVERTDGTHLDLWLVHPPAEWACQLAIRTGPAALGQLVMARLRIRGFVHTGGHIEELGTNRPVPVPDEETFFSLAGLPCLVPEQRGTPEAMRPITRTASP